MIYLNRGHKKELRDRVEGVMRVSDKFIGEEVGRRFPERDSKVLYDREWYFVKAGFFRGA